MNNDEMKRNSLRGSTKLGRCIMYLGMTTNWCDGDGIAMVFKWYHPLSWILVPVLVVGYVIVYGASELIAHPEDLGLGMNSYWKKNKDRRVFITVADIYKFANTYRGTRVPK